MTQNPTPDPLPSPTADPLAGLSPVELFRAAGEPAAPHGSAPDVGEIADAFPKLEILGLIGQGGIGFVYKARQPDLDRIVALKILRPELGLDPAFAERFSREARVLGKLNHPNIVSIFEHGHAGRFFYLLMEHVDGVNLRQAMRAGRFTPEQALAIVPGICDALQAAHAQGVWHRDIKPENILLDQDGRVKIVDFGIARIIGDPARDFTLTLTGAALGSAPYMAPEQHERPHEVDHRADIYSLGVVFYEMLTGELPLGRFPNPSARADVHARIDAIVLQTLEKERELRQQTATEVKTDIQRAARDGGSPAATTAPAPSRAESWLSRLPTLVQRSLIAWLGGLFLLGIGLLLDVERVSGAAFPLSIGGVAAALGLLGGLWSLFEMRRGWLPATGRGLLISTMLVPALLAAAWAGAAVGLVGASEGIIPYQLTVPLAFTATLLLAWPLRHFLFAEFQRPRRWLITAACLLTIALTGGKFLHGTWPFLDARHEEIHFLSGNQRANKDALMKDFKLAVGDLGAIYEISTAPDSQRFTLSGIRLGQGQASDAKVAESITVRLNQLSGPEGVTWRLLSHSWTPAHRSRDFSLLLVIAGLAGLSALAALCVAGCHWRPGLFLIFGTSLAAGLATVTPGRSPGPEDRYIPRDLTPLPPFTIDLSSPEATARTIQLAARDGLRDILRQAVTPELARKLDLRDEWDLFSQPDVAVRLTPGNFKILDDQKRAVRNPNGVGESFTLIRGKWLMDTPAYGRWQPEIPAATTTKTSKPEAKKEDPVEIIRLLNRLANEQNAEAFLARKWKSGISFGGITPAQQMEPFYGEILMARELPDEDENRASVVTKLKRADGSVKYVEFDLMMQDGEWRMFTEDTPKYRAWTLIEFKPAQGNAAAILKNHFGKKTFHPVKDSNERFAIGGEGRSGADAKADAEWEVVRLKKSLAAAGLDKFLRTLAPPAEPAEPWMGEDPVVPEIPSDNR